MDYVFESLVGQTVFHKKMDGEFILISEPKNSHTVVIKDNGGNDIITNIGDILIDLDYIK